uniref:Acyl-CoA dehydrogenase n=1 Tax=Denticeps clupeoides TaxID=299321 RepID=A0AAY4DAM2_9TELE
FINRICCDPRLSVAAGRHVYRPVIPATGTGRHFTNWTKAFLESFNHSAISMRPNLPATTFLTSATAIGMRRIFQKDHLDLREAARGFFRREVVPEQKKRMEESDVTLSRDIFEKAGAKGLLGLSVPQEYGGNGDIISSAILWEEQVYSKGSWPSFPVHSDLTMSYITKYGSEEQIKRYIPNMLAGKCIGSVAIKEPSNGSDIRDIRSYAWRDGSDWLLNGTKTMVINGSLSDMVIVAANTNHPSLSNNPKLSLFLVEGKLKGFKKGNKVMSDQVASHNIASELIFDNVRLPKEALLGEADQACQYILEQLPLNRILIADLTLAAAEIRFDNTLLKFLLEDTIKSNIQLQTLDFVPHSPWMAIRSRLLVWNDLGCPATGGVTSETTGSDWS